MAGEVEPKDTMEGRRGSPQEIRKALLALPRVSREDVEELQRLIREAKSPAPEGGIFD